MKSIATAFATLAICALSADQSQAQVVTSYYIGPAPAVATPAVATPVITTPGVTTPGVTTPPIIGTIPVRAGLFGLRTDYIPVFGAPVAPATAITAPLVSGPIGSLPYQSGRPVIAPSPYGVATPYQPGSVYAPAPAYGYGYNSFYSGSFYPGAVMTMQ